MFVFPLILYDVSVLFIAFNNPVWNQRCLHCMLRKWPLPPPAIQRGKPLSSTFHPRLAATNVREPTNTNDWFRRDNDSKSFRMLANVQKRMQTFLQSWIRAFPISIILFFNLNWFKAKLCFTGSPWRTVTRHPYIQVKA